MVEGRGEVGEGTEWSGEVERVWFTRVLSFSRGICGDRGVNGRCLGAFGPSHIRATYELGMGVAEQPGHLSAFGEGRLGGIFWSGKASQAFGGE